MTTLQAVLDADALALDGVLANIREHGASAADALAAEILATGAPGLARVFSMAAETIAPVAAWLDSASDGADGQA